MKTALVFLLGLTTLFTGTLASAATSAMPSSVCYKLDLSKAPYSPSRAFPARICIDSVKVDAKAQTIEVRSIATPEYVQNLRIAQVATSAGVQSFHTDAVIFEEGKACSDGEQLRLIIEGKLSKSGAVSPASLRVAIAHTTSPDICHSEPSTSYFDYTR